MYAVDIIECERCHRLIFPGEDVDETVIGVVCESCVGDLVGVDPVSY